MDNLIKELEPKDFYRFFSELSAIPRGSGNEKAVSDYVYNYAVKKGLEVVQDDNYNLIIKKPGSKGCENAPVVIIQGHLDMVCEKNNDTVHDFLTEGIKLVVDGDFLRADGTTLGGDNGAAVAYAMMLLDSDSIYHPPLTIMLTVAEETGMIGAMALEARHVSGKRLINLDSFMEGVFTVSCAGGLRTNVVLNTQRISPPSNFRAFNLSVTGLKGGHSGLDIDKERGNANRILGRLLSALNNELDVYVASLKGGEKENAIPREADARLYIAPAACERAAKLIATLSSDIKKEYSVSDHGLKICFQESEPVSQETVLTKEYAKKVLAIIQLMPDGVQNRNVDLPGIQTSINIGVIRSNDVCVRYSSSIRSSVASRKYYVLDMVKNAADSTGAVLTMSGDYPAWEYSPESELIKICTDVFKSMYGGKEPELHAIHAGIECGVLKEKEKGLDIISLGPDLFDAHTPEERISISSIKRVWEFLVNVLGKLDK